MLLAGALDAAVQAGMMAQTIGEDGSGIQEGARKVWAFGGTSILALWILFSLGKPLRILTGVVVWLVAGAFTFLPQGTLSSIGTGIATLVGTIVGWFV